AVCSADLLRRGGQLGQREPARRTPQVAWQPPASARAGVPPRRHALRPWPGLAQTQRPVRSTPRSRALLSRVSQRAGPDARHSCTYLLVKTCRPKQGDIVAGTAMLSEISEDFPNHTAKFKAMARKT